MSAWPAIVTVAGGVATPAVGDVLIVDLDEVVENHDYAYDRYFAIHGQPGADELVAAIAIAWPDIPAQFQAEVGD